MCRRPSLAGFFDYAISQVLLDGSSLHYGHTFKLDVND